MNSSEDMPRPMSKSTSVSYNNIDNVESVVLFFELLLELGNLNYLYTELGDSILLEF